MKYIDHYYENKQDWEEWEYEYVDNNVVDCENTHNEEYYLDECQVTENGLDYYCGGEIPHADDDGKTEDRKFNVKECLNYAEFETEYEEEFQ